MSKTDPNPQMSTTLPIYQDSQVPKFQDFQLPMVSMDNERLDTEKSNLSKNSSKYEEKTKENLIEENKQLKREIARMGKDINLLTKERNEFGDKFFALQSKYPDKLKQLQFQCQQLLSDKEELESELERSESDIQVLKKIKRQDEKWLEDERKILSSSVIMKNELSKELQETFFNLEKKEYELQKTKQENVNLKLKLDQNENIEKIVFEKNEEIENLNDQLKTMDYNLSQRQKSENSILKVLEARIKKLENEVHDSEQGLTSMGKENSELHLVIEQLHLQLKKTTQELKKKAEELSAKEEKVFRKSSQSNRLEQRLSSTNRDLGILDGENRQLKAIVELLEQEKKTFQEEKNLLLEKVEKKEEEIKDCRKQTDERINIVESFYSKLQKLQEEFKQLETENSKLGKIVLQKNSFIENLNEEIQDIKKNQDLKEEAEKEKEDYLKELSKDYFDVVAQLKQKQKEFDNLKTEIKNDNEKDSRIAKLDEYVKNNIYRIQNFDHLHTENIELKEKNLKLSSENMEYKNLNENLNKKICVIKEENEQLQQEVETKKFILKEQEKNLEKYPFLLQEIKSLKENLEKANSQLNLQNSDIQNQLKEKKNLEKEVTQVNHRLKQTTQSLNEMEKQLAGSQLRSITEGRIKIEIKELEKKFKDQGEELEIKQKRCNELEILLKEANLPIENLKEKILDLESELSKSEQEIKKCNMMLTAEKKKIEQLKIQYKQSQNFEVEKIKETLLKKEEIIKDLKEKLGNNKDRENQIQKLERLLYQTKEAKDSANIAGKLAELESKYRILEQENLNFMNLLEVKDNSIRNLGSKLAKYYQENNTIPTLKRKNRNQQESIKKLQIELMNKTEQLDNSEKKMNQDQLKFSEIEKQLSVLREELSILDTDNELTIREFDKNRTAESKDFIKREGGSLGLNLSSLNHKSKSVSYFKTMELTTGRKKYKDHPFASFDQTENNREYISKNQNLEEKLKKIEERRGNFKKIKNVSEENVKNERSRDQYEIRLLKDNSNFLKGKVIKLESKNKRSEELKFNKPESTRRKD